MSWLKKFSEWLGIIIESPFITNIGSLFDKTVIHVASEFNRSSGILKLENCTIDWLFSFDEGDVDEFISEDQYSYRSIQLNGKDIDFSDVPEDLHTTSYKKILKGQGFTLEDARSSLEIIESINHHN